MKLRTTYLLSAFALLAPTLAQAQSCDPAANLLGFEIRAVDTKDVVVDTSYSMRELDRRARKPGWGGKLLGQTEAQFGARLISEDVGCGRKVVVLELQLVKQTVRIAGDLPRDSCTFIQTHEHELEHVEINRKVLVDVQREFSNRMDATRFATDAELKVAVMADVVPGVYKRFTESGRLHSLFDEKDHDADRSQECRRDLAMRTM